jgi:hypothetical protein
MNWYVSQNDRAVKAIAEDSTDVCDASQMGLGRITYVGNTSNYLTWAYLALPKTPQLF